MIKDEYNLILIYCYAVFAIQNYEIIAVLLAKCEAFDPIRDVFCLMSKIVSKEHV
jgi:hypothetical protein